MKIRNLCYLLTILFVFSVSGINAQTTEFTYQGRLTDGGMPPTANYDFEFALYAQVGSGVLLGTRERLNVPVNNGAFTVSLDFPATNFDGGNRVLEIRVKPAGSGGGYTVLSPRQKITSSPYSIRSLNATNADNATNATNADNANLLDGFLTATVFTTGQRIYVSRTDGFLPSGTVNSLSIADGTISSGDLEISAVTSSKIAPNAVINSKIENNAVTNSKIADNAVTNSKIANGAVNSSKLDSDLGIGMFSGSTVYANGNGVRFCQVSGYTNFDDSDGLVGNVSLSPNRLCSAKNLIVRILQFPLISGESLEIFLYVNGSISTFGCTITFGNSTCNTGLNALNITPGSQITMSVKKNCTPGNCTGNEIVWGWECR